MSTLPKTNIYRCTEKCKNCPFKDNGKAIHLEEGRVDSIRKMLLEEHDSSFSCHKTVYNLDSDMEDTEEQTVKMCAGAFEYLQEHGKANAQMRLAYQLGIDSPKRKV